MACRGRGERLRRPATRWQAPGSRLCTARLFRDVKGVTWHSATTTKCNFGSERFWFYCPNCDRRAASIFVVGPPFRCRVCLRLTYQSQRQRYGDRVLARSVRISRRLGGTTDAFSFASKPKGMHSRTYERLLEELRDLKLALYGHLAVRFKFPGFENPEEGDLGCRKPRPYRRRVAETI